MTADRSQRVMTALLYRNHRALQRRYQVYCENEQTIRLEDIELPAGWTPSVITVSIEIPDHYPESAPRWRFPGTLRYHGRVPRHLLTSGQWLCRGTLGDDFIWWPERWQPDRSTLRGVTDQALADLVTLDEADAVEGPDA